MFVASLGQANVHFPPYITDETMYLVVYLLSIDLFFAYALGMSDKCNLVHTPHHLPLPLPSFGLFCVIHCDKGSLSDQSPLYIC